MTTAEKLQQRHTYADYLSGTGFVTPFFTFHVLYPHMKALKTLRNGSSKAPTVGALPPTFMQSYPSYRAYQLPVFSIESHGSASASGSPFCSNSIEIASGERTNAMCPSRGGRLINTPASISF